MQTFLPYPDYIASMRCLDRIRLGNQIWREGKTLLGGGWPNHPVSKMWKGYEHQLCLYCVAGLYALAERGHHYPTWFAYFNEQMLHVPFTPPPPWLGDERLHSSHRANLLRKDEDYYSQFGWTEEPTEGYYWP